MWWSSCCGLVIVLLCLMNVAHIQAQCQRTYIDGNRVMAKGTYEDTYANGATLTFKCATGYVSVYPSASKTITCQEGTWSRLELQCKRRSCGNPGDILNGAYDLTNGIEYGSIATVKCNEGYELVGQISIRQCLAIGAWDGRPPLCEAVRCPKPPSIANGQIDFYQDYYTYKQAVTYSCVGGTFLFGTKTLTCSADRTFKPDPPECTSVQCPAVRIANGFRARGKYEQSYELNEFLQFKCDDGYEMEGADHIICQQNGWDPPPPTCRNHNSGEELQAPPVAGRGIAGTEEHSGERCPKPPSIQDGQFNPQKESYAYNETVTYNCTGNKYIFGFNILTCSQNGAFRPDPPQCTDEACPRVRVKNGYRTIGKSTPPYELLNYLVFTCDHGYRMEGENLILCTQNGWDPPPPTCKAAPAVYDVNLIHLILLIVMLIMQVIFGIGFLRFFCKKRSQ